MEVRRSKLDLERSERVRRDDEGGVKWKGAAHEAEAVGEVEVEGEVEAGVEVVSISGRCSSFFFFPFFCTRMKHGGFGPGWSS